MILKRRIRGFTLIELLVVIAIIALLISILLPSLSRARELSKRLVCQSNIKGIGTSAKIYANDNNEKWMIPPFDRDTDYGSGQRIKYSSPSGVDVGFKREDPTFSRDDASTQLSVTRAFWMLVRTGDVTPKQYICPSSGDSEDPTENIDFYYDFLGPTNDPTEHISYGYQVPFGPRDTQPREGVDNRQVLAADKGPFYAVTGQVDWTPASLNREVDLDASPKDWMGYNSGNHGGARNGEGQNALFADGHATFARMPAVGIDHDNIYTLMAPTPWDGLGFNRIHGIAPGEYASEPPFPGDDTLGPSAYSSTDSLIYP